MTMRERGFTLLEVLLATTLLASALALAFGVLRAAGASVQRGDAIAQRNERMRAVSEFLRQRIGGARGQIFEPDPQSGETPRFLGSAQHMAFVAEVPDQLERGGPQLHTLTIKSAANGLQLRVHFQRVQAGKLLAATADEPLADALTQAEFAYRALDANGMPGTWTPNWSNPAALPLQVRVRMRDAQGAWPEMVVALTQAGNFAAVEQVRTP